MIIVGINIILIAFNSNITKDVNEENHSKDITINEIKVNYDKTSSKYILTFMATNISEENIDASNYNINLLNESGETIYVVGGEAIGKLNKKDSINVAVEVDRDILLTKTITITLKSTPKRT